MLTIRHYEPDGSESIRQAKTLFVEPEDKSTGKKQVVWIDNGGGGTADFGYSSGTVYVMNDDGKTIAVYRLEWPAPPE